jgi:phosphoglycerate dehydrogenase-like enzyme
MADIVVLITLPFPDHLIERLRALSSRIRVEVVPARSAQELPAELLPEVEVLYTSRALPDPQDVPALQWVQFHYAGIDHVADHPLLRKEGLQVTTLSGVAAPGMAEFALMCMLALGRHLPAIMDDKLHKRWPKDRFERYQPVELRGSMVGIVGYGSIGREIARLCRAMGAGVLACKHDLKHLDDPGYAIDGLGDPQAELAQRIYPPQAVASMAAECDFLVVVVPLTPETRGMIDEGVLERMKPSAFLVDISRGGVVDHGALIQALREKKLAGAALDVYPVEPLPQSSPLWEMSNVILTPHLAGASPHYYERAMDLFVENFRRYLAGQPLLNRFDPQRGY